MDKRQAPFCLKCPSLSRSHFSGLTPALTASTCLPTLHTPCCMRNCSLLWKKPAHLVWSETDKSNTARLCVQHWLRQNVKGAQPNLKDPGIVLEIFLIILDIQYVCHCYGSVRQSLSLSYEDLYDCTQHSRRHSTYFSINH